MSASMARASQDVYLPNFLSCSPWMWPVRAAGARLPPDLQDFPSREQLTALYDAHVCDEQPALRFVAEAKSQSRRRAGSKRAADRYDGLITLRHEVPTRAGNWHDLLNALCFATFPRSKRALHRRQFEALLAREPAPDKPWPNARTREQDALTLLDEGGILVAVTDPNTYQEAKPLPSADLVHALCATQQAQVVPFGHAVLEHLIKGEPCPGGRACVVRVTGPLVADEHLLGQLDTALCRLVEDPDELQAPGASACRLVLSDPRFTP